MGLKKKKSIFKKCCTRESRREEEAGLRSFHFESSEFILATVM